MMEHIMHPTPDEHQPNGQPDQQSKSAINGSIARQATMDAFKKMKPVNMIKQPIMFVVWIGCLLAIGYTIFIDEMRGFNLTIASIKINGM